jgi:hypothetical protein
VPSPADLSWPETQMNGDIVTLLGAHLKSILYGLVFLVAVISAFAHRSLFNNLKRHDPAQWVALGSPELFRLPTKRDFTGINSMRDEQRFFWYILSMKYRRSEKPEIRISGDVVLGCFVVIWVSIICLLTVGR